MFTREEYEAGVRAAFQVGFKKGLTACAKRLTLKVRIGKRADLVKNPPKGLRKIVTLQELSDKAWTKMSDNEKRSYLDREIDAYYC